MLPTSVFRSFEDRQRNAIIAQAEAMEGWDWNLTNEEMNAKMAAKRAEE